MTETDDSIMETLLVLELLRDEVETTDDETEIVNAAHVAVQEYRDEIRHHLKD